MKQKPTQPMNKNITKVVSSKFNQNAITEEIMSSRHSENTYDNDEFEDVSKSHFSASKKDSKSRRKPSDTYSMTFEDSARGSESRSKQKTTVKSPDAETRDSKKKFSTIPEDLKETSYENSNVYTSMTESGAKDPTAKFNVKLKIDDVSSSSDKNSPLKKTVIEKSHGQTTISVSGLSSSMFPNNKQSKEDVESQYETDQSALSVSD